MSWYAYLKVGSDAPLAEVEATIGVPSDGGYSVGDAHPRARSRPPHKKTCTSSFWRHRLSWRASRHAGVDGINRALVALPAEMADGIRRRVEAGDKASLVIVQELDGLDPIGSCGLALEPAALAWMARAGVSLDLDQYAELAGEPDEVPLGYLPPVDPGWWRDAMAASARSFETTFEKSPGHVPELGSNTVVPFHDAGPRESRPDLPEPLARFYVVVQEVSLPDVHTGYAIHPARWLADAGRRGFPVAVRTRTGTFPVVPFGADGVGFFALVPEDGRIVHLPRAQVHGTTWLQGDEPPGEVAAGLDVFLRRLLDVVDELIETGETRGITWQR
ncbi:hypothetical protein [Myceligenerans crystallogenes]|uniref:Uncharacterized protein n=1 Tax=Myceligenerans crystallogenes TaxID=316335 RepID=A0ABP4ZVL7_9MICO